MISSLSNPKVKYVRRLQTDRRFRHREQVFIAEGTRWLEEVLAHPNRLKQLYVQSDWSDSAEHQQILTQLSVKGQNVSDEVMRAMSDTESPPGVLAVLEMKSRPLPSNPEILLVLDALNDPGNLGTILRTAVAAGVNGVFLAPGSVDAFNPKVVRSAMGAHLHLSMHNLDWQEISDQVKGMAVYLAAGEGETIYSEVDWTCPTVLIIGNEAHGGGYEARALTKHTISIPMNDQAESLNAAVAAGIILFERVRQLRMKVG